MSMNLTLYAKVECILKFKSGDKLSHRHERFKLWQTPTEIAYQALEGNPYDVYKEWVLSISEDKEEPVHSSEDIWCKGPPIYFQIFNRGKDHLKQLDHWLERYKDWNIEWEIL